MRGYYTMRENKKKHILSKSIKLANVATFVILWHFFFASSFVLRLNPVVFWPVLFVVSIFVGFKNKVQIGRAELEILLFSFFGLLFCFFSEDPWTAAINELYFFCYICVAAMIARFTNGETIRAQIMFFCIIHLVCIYVQVLLPSVYENVILPLLPSYSYSDILYQMKYNLSYQGFTVQTSITAMYMTFGAIISAINAKYEKKRVKKIVDVAFVFLFISGILFVTRRGSLLTIMLILSCIYFDKSRNKLSRVILFISGIIFLMCFGIEYIPGMQGMLGKFTRLSGNIMNGRLKIWKIALDNFWNYPLFGYGVGRANVTGGGGSVDNAYIAVLVERGIIGAITFFVPYLHLLFQTLKRKKSSVLFSKSLDISLYFQLLFAIMSLMENYYGQALTMFVYYIMVFSDQYDTHRRIIDEHD